MAATDFNPDPEQAQASVPAPGPAPVPEPVPGPAPVRKLYRIPDGRMLGGVANGLAAHLGVGRFWVRVAFVVLLLGNGLGALLYAAFWFAVPMGLRAGAAPATTWQVGNIGPYSLEKQQRGLRRVRQLLQQTLDSYHCGLQITELTLSKVSPPDALVPAFADTIKQHGGQILSKPEANALKFRAPDGTLAEIVSKGAFEKHA